MHRGQAATGLRADAGRPANQRHSQGVAQVDGARAGCPGLGQAVKNAAPTGWRGELCIGQARVNRPLLQLGVLRLGLFQDGNVGVGVFPEGKEVLVSLLCLSSVAGDCVGTAEA